MYLGQLTTYNIMKKTNMNTKYIWLLIILIGFTACNDVEDVLADNNAQVTTEMLPELNSGSADFSNYVALGASFTSGFTDNALFIASQENSFPNILSKEFTKVNGGSFNQPLMSDNFGGLAVAGNRITNPRLVFGGAGPVALESIIGPVTVGTDIALNNPTGPFQNLGVPGAKSFHLLANGYGNIANFPAAANPYAVRLTGSTPDASIIELAMAQNPTFFTLSEIGGNDVLGYATSGGDGSNPITDTTMFNGAFNALVSTLTSGGAKGAVTNVPYITDLPHFTTVPYNPVPLDAATSGLLNAGYAQYNGGLQLALANDLIDADEAAARTIMFSASANNTMVVIDENLTDLSGLGLPNYRPSTASDLFVLPLSSLIPEGYGTQIPLDDKWVLTPEEQEEIKNATDAYNDTIASVASSNENIALVDLNSILQEATINGIVFDNYTLQTSLVTGGLVSLDGIHLTARGYAYMANKFLETIDAEFGSNFIASGNVAKAGDYPTNYSPLLQ